MRIRILCIALFLCASVIAQKWAPVGDKIKTQWAEKVTPENVWQEYPRPQFERSEWVNLNGLWEYSVTKKNILQPKKFQGNILVPFCLESSLSGVGKKVTPEDRIWYKRKFEIPSNWNRNTVILNFEAVDYSATVWVNGAVVGSHKGAYDRFSFDITDYLSESGNQEIVVCVDDPSSFGAQPRGKQQMPQQGIWYTPVSGIWQTVWLEAVSTEAYLKEVKVETNIDKELVSVIPMLSKPLKPDYQVKIAVMADDQEVASSEVMADKKVDIKIESPQLWSPDNPFLYDLKLTLVNASGDVIDEVNSYFGMRKISLGDLNGNKYLFLNNKPLFHYGMLDQG